MPSRHTVTKGGGPEKQGERDDAGPVVGCGPPPYDGKRGARILRESPRIHAATTLGTNRLHGHGGASIVVNMGYASWQVGPGAQRGGLGGMSSRRDVDGDMTGEMGGRQRARG